MGRPIGVNILRIFIFVVNILTFLIGLGILGLGLYIHLGEAPNNYRVVSQQDETCQDCSKAIEALQIPIVLMSFGGFMTLLACLGALGSMCESSCFLWLYSAILIVCIGAEVVCSILIAVKTDQIDQCLECSMKHQIVSEYNNTNFLYGKEYEKKDHNKTTLITQTWDTLQVEFKCCGATGPEDYRLSAWRNQTILKVFEKQVPPTCCKLTNTDYKKPSPINSGLCQFYSQKMPEIFSESYDYVNVKGCHDRFREWFDSHKYIGICVLVGIIIFQIVACVASCILLVYYRREAEKDHYNFGSSNSDYELEGLNK